MDSILSFTSPYLFTVFPLTLISIVGLPTILILVWADKFRFAADKSLRGKLLLILAVCIALLGAGYVGLELLYFWGVVVFPPASIFLWARYVKNKMDQTTPLKARLLRLVTVAMLVVLAFAILSMCYVTYELSK